MARKIAKATVTTKGKRIPFFDQPQEMRDACYAEMHNDTKTMILEFPGPHALDQPSLATLEPSMNIDALTVSKQFGEEYEKQFYFIAKLSIFAHRDCQNYTTLFHMLFGDEDTDIEPSVLPEKLLNRIRHVAFSLHVDNLIKPKAFKWLIRAFPDLLTIEFEFRIGMEALRMATGEMSIYADPNIFLDDMKWLTDANWLTNLNTHVSNFLEVLKPVKQHVRITGHLVAEDYSFTTINVEVPDIPNANPTLPAKKLYPNVVGVTDEELHALYDEAESFDNYVLMSMRAATEEEIRATQMAKLRALRPEDVQDPVDAWNGVKFEIKKAGHLNIERYSENRGDL